MTWFIYALISAILGVGYALADASLVVPVVSLSTVFTVIVGIAFLGERDNIVKKIIAGILAFIGLLLIKM